MKNKEIRDSEVIDPIKTGQFIKRIRLELGMSQKGLAEKVFLTRKAVSKWETGKSCPSLDVIKRLAVILHATIEEICEGEFRDGNKNVNNKKPLNIVVNSKIFKVSIVVILILLISGIFITYNDKRTTVYSINTLSDDFYLKNASIVKSGDNEIINFGNFQCDLKDVSEDTVYNFKFYIKTDKGEEELFSYSYVKWKSNSLVSHKKILNKIYDEKNNEIYLEVSYYNNNNEYRKYDIKIILKKLKKYDADYNYSKYNEIGKIGKEETQPVVGTEDTQGMINIGFLFEMSKEELLEKYLIKDYIVNKITYTLMYESSQLYVIQDKMRLSINIETKKAVLKNGFEVIHLKLVNNHLDLSLVSDKHKNNLKTLFQIIK